MGYTLKLDLSDYQHHVLVELLSEEIQAGVQVGLNEGPRQGALMEILDQIAGYDEAVAYAKAVTE